MARKPSPWYRAERGEWWVRFKGEDHNLGKHPDDAPTPKKSPKTGKWNAPKVIEEAFYKLMRQEPPAPRTPTGDAVATVLDQFLTWCRSNREDKTTQRYTDFIQEFVRFEIDGKKVGLFGVGELHAGHVTKWLATKTTWGNTTKKNAITGLQRGLNWAVKNLGVPRNPIKGMEKPQAEARTETVTPEEFEKALTFASPQFKDLLIVSYDSGARPQEVKGLEARHIDLVRQRAVLPTREAKGKKRPRVIYFPTERSMDIIKRLCEEHPECAIFRNTKGNQWTGYAVKCCFARMDEKIGRRLHQYMFRRTRITEMIIAGVDSHVVAQLSGHSNTDMIDRVYSAIADNHDYMLQQAKAGINPKKDSEG